MAGKNTVPEQATGVAQREQAVPQSVDQNADGVLGHSRGEPGLAGHLETLRQRARMLAGRVDAGSPAPGATDYLVFQLADRRYAVPLSAVAELTGARFISRVPGAPPQVFGVTGLRGDICPVVDLRAALQDHQARQVSSVVFLKAAWRPVGLVADRILGLQPLPDEIVSSFQRRAYLDAQFRIGLLADTTIILDHMSICDLVAPEASVVHVEAGTIKPDRGG